MTGPIAHLRAELTADEIARLQRNGANHLAAFSIDAAMSGYLTLRKKIDAGTPAFDHAK